MFKIKPLIFFNVFVSKVEGVYGSRMTGGGFGGCTVTLLKKVFINFIDSFNDVETIYSFKRVYNYK